MSHVANELWYENRAQWLEENSAKEADVFMDERGEEFIQSQTENGNPGEEGYGFIMGKLYLPEKLQTNYEPDYKLKD